MEPRISPIFKPKSTVRQLSIGSLVATIVWIGSTIFYWLIVFCFYLVFLNLLLFYRDLLFIFLEPRVLPTFKLKSNFRQLTIGSLVVGFVFLFAY